MAMYQCQPWLYGLFAGLTHIPPIPPAAPKASWATGWLLAGIVAMPPGSLATSCQCQQRQLSSSASNAKNKDFFLILSSKDQWCGNFTIP